MATLWITRGLPASGKSTWARKQLANRELGSIVRLNRDDLRRMGLDPDYRQPVYAAEQRVSAMRDASLSALLSTGCDVIVDDTSLRAKYVRELMTIARRAGAGVEFVDFTDVPLEECIRRDATRVGVEHVGEAVIRKMHRQFLAQLHGNPLPIPGLTETDAEVARPYVAPDAAEWCVLADLDGTLALLDRSPYDETCVLNDRPNEAVVYALQALIETGLRPVFMSGRTEACRADTETWLRKHVLDVSAVELHMRAIGDTRPDQVVKLELFDRYVRDRYNVRMVFDDRNSVVALWRSLGLTCLQVADGDF